MNKQTYKIHSKNTTLPWHLGKDYTSDLRDLKFVHSEFYDNNIRANPVSYKVMNYAHNTSHFKKIISNLVKRKHFPRYGRANKNRRKRVVSIKFYEKKTDIITHFRRAEIKTDKKNIIKEKPFSWTIRRRTFTFHYHKNESVTTLESEERIYPS